MNSVELVKQICIERKIPISKLERDCGFSNGYIRKLKEGKFPSDRLLLISQYLDLPISYLLGEEDFDSENLTSNDKRDIAKDLVSIMEKLNSKEAGPASFDGNDIPEDDRELFAAQLEAMLVRLKKINKELYNPNKNKK
jgi:transcriptional regulator with XRE-family HTH domain